MLIANIKLNNNIINEISELLIDNVFIINIYEDGICLTQNVNEISNLSIFVDKFIFDKFEISDENSFVTSNIEILKNIIIEKNNNSYKLNNKNCIINKSCNVCKNFKYCKFKILEDTNLNIDPKLHFIKNSKLSICNSNSFNGTVIKSIINNFILYINILLEDT